jgi:hypothetical protein
LKRLGELLGTQRGRFEEYLQVLDGQFEAIQTGTAESLAAHIRLEEKLAQDIFALRKVIDPLEAICPLNGLSGEEAGICGLKSALEELRQEAALRISRNKDLLTKRMEEVRSELKAMRGNPYAVRRSIYADSLAPSMIDIQG